MSHLLLFYTFVLGLFTSLAQIPLISRLAVNIGILDKSDDRKVHSGGIPRLGGIAIFFSVLLAILLFSSVDQIIKAYLVGGIIIFLTGLSDDLQGLSPRQKFLGEFVAATVAIVLGGQGLTSLGDLLGFGEILLQSFSLPFTIVALVGVINAINLIDGLDGLAGGITAIASLGFLILAGLAGNHGLMYVTVALFGATIGFLKFNTHPAQIFMGDSGSLFLGYSLGFCAINLTVAGGGTVSPVTPLIILALPIVDTLVVVARRGVRGDRFLSPDKSHLHHRMLALGFSHRMVVVLIYVLAYGFALAAVVFRKMPDSVLFYGLLATLVLGYVNLRLMERERQRYGALKLFSIKIPYPKLHHNPHLQRTYIWLLRIAKYLLVTIFALSMFIPPVIRGVYGVIAFFFIIFIGLMYALRNALNNRIPLVTIYFIGAFFIYLMQNHMGNLTLFGVTLQSVSTAIFGLLFIVLMLMAAIRANPTAVLSTPLEYLIIFLVISVPLFPEPFRQQHQLLMVAGKSVILFVALKLVLKPRAYRNRKIILAALASLLVITLRNLLSF